MEEKKRDFQKARDAFNQLKVDPSSVAFAEETLDKKLLLKLKKSKSAEDEQFFKLVSLLENKSSVIIEPVTVNRTEYAEKREIDNTVQF